MIVPRVGVPEDPAQWAALALGVGALVGGARALGAARRREGMVVAVLAVLAALLSWGYVVGYLRGGPRIIDATSYWLEARALAGGYVSWPVGEPETAVLGRFLVRSEGAEGARAAVLFPPGYPLLLALGFLVGAPLAVGPLLAAALVVATYALAREVVRGAGAGESGARGARGARGAGESVAAGGMDLGGVPLVAAALSVVCGAARYHTADTMSHGLAAVCFAAGLTFVLRARRAESGRAAWGQAMIAGWFGGWLFATRPASGLAWGVTVGVVLMGGLGRGEGRAGARDVRDVAGRGLAVLVGALPFAIVFLVHQRLATGVWLVSTHAATYATNDGPAGCFRYGFGEGIGCLGEHGDFVRANLPDGFGFVAAVKTTARRLWMHLVDAGNAEPLALLVPAGAALAWARGPAVRVLAVAIGCQIAAYAPFYFDGNYPGGGARLFADVLAMEHVLLAIAAVRITAIAARGAAEGEGSRGAAEGEGEGARGARGAGAWIVGLALIGLGVRAGFDHAQLRDRDGGAPLFSEGEMRAQGVSSGLVFVESDAAFDLAFDPGARALGVVRRKGDALDVLAWRERGSPPAFVARFEEAGAGGRGRTVVEPYAGIDRLPAWIEGESLWPPRAQVGGAFVGPVYAGGTCASAGRGLRLFRGPGAGGHVRIGVPAALAAGRSIDVVLLTGGEAGQEDARVAVSVEVDGERVAGEEVVIAAGAAGAEPVCASGVRAGIRCGARKVDVVVEPRWSGGRDPEGGPLVVLDRVLIAGGSECD